MPKIIHARHVGNNVPVPSGHTHAPYFSTRISFDSRLANFSLFFFFIKEEDKEKKRERGREGERKKLYRDI